MLLSIIIDIILYYNNNALDHPYNTINHNIQETNNNSFILFKTLILYLRFDFID